VGGDLCLDYTTKNNQQLVYRPPPPAHQPPSAGQPRLVFPAPLQGTVASQLAGQIQLPDPLQAAAAAPMAGHAGEVSPLAGASATAAGLAPAPVEKKSVEAAGALLGGILQNASAKKAVAKPKAKGKAKAGATKANGKVKAGANIKPKSQAAKPKVKGQGSPTIIVENSRGQIKAWAGLKGIDMNRVVSFKTTTQMKARKTAVEWLVKRCKELKIDVPIKIQASMKSVC